jgi:thiamine biosynthesis lipoprotein
MATRFELLVWDDRHPARLRAAAEEALAAITRAEERLSRFRPTSEIAWINARAGGEAVRVTPAVFDLLARCGEISRLTGGAFDPTVGPLVRTRGPGNAAAPHREGVEGAPALVGMDRVELDAAARTARLPEAGMEMDLGAIGKGAALDEAVALLREAEISTALLHGGTSSVHTVGRPPGDHPWRLGWRVPGEETPRVVELDPGRPALAVSASPTRIGIRGREDHVIDPRSSRPLPRGGGALVSGPTSTLCDALSTALLVLGPAGRPALEGRFTGYRFEVAAPAPPAGVRPRRGSREPPAPRPGSRPGA